MLDANIITLNENVGYSTVVVAIAAVRFAEYHFSVALGSIPRSSNNHVAETCWWSQLWGIVRFLHRDGFLTNAVAREVSGTEKPLYIAIIELTKAFDLVSRQGLFILLKRMGCSPRVLRIILSFLKDVQGTMHPILRLIFEPIPNQKDVKQGCVLTQTLFHISLLLPHAFDRSNDGIYLHTRRNLHDSVQKPRLIREVLFADDAAVTSHTDEALQGLINWFASVLIYLQNVPSSSA